MEKSAEKAAKATLLAGFCIVIVFFALLFVKNLPKEGAQEDEAQLANQVLQNSPHRGPVEAEVIIVEFGDFECPGCRDVAPIIEAALENNKDKVQQIWIHAFNTLTHYNSEQAAIASQCAYEQNKFWEFHDQVFANQENLSQALFQQIAVAIKLNMAVFQQCLADPETHDTIQAHRQFAIRNDVSQTPTVFVNSRRLQGSFTLDQLNRAIEDELLKNAS